MVNRTVAPAFVEPAKFNLPQPEVIQLSNNHNFYSLQVGDQPVIKTGIYL